MGIFDTLHGKQKFLRVHAHLKQEGTVTVGIDPQADFRDVGSDHVVLDVRRENQFFCFSSNGYGFFKTSLVRKDVQAIEHHSRASATARRWSRSSWMQVTARSGSCANGWRM